MHWGTFPLLTGTPDQLKALVSPKGIDVLMLKPGETAAIERPHQLRALRALRG
jgi:hypothetical protein